MREMILAKTGELILKGGNRRRFQDMLKGNMKRSLKAVGDFQIYDQQATVYVLPEREDDIDEMVGRLSKVFGIVNLSRAGIIEKDMEKIMNFAPEYLSDALMGVNTFKVESRRADKTFPYKSPEISAMVGGALLDAFPHLTVDVINPDVVVRVEVRDTDAFVYAGRIKAAGGMPTGTNGRAMLLLSGGIDSPVAGHMIAKRGVYVEGIHFFSYPYTGEKAKEKVLTLADRIADYTGSMPLHIVPFTEAQLAIRDNCPSEHMTLIMRRMMMKIANEVAKKRECQGLITGESIGQVASQTVWALGVTDSVTDIPVFRPCIGMDKDEIVQIARKIDTFETSILPYEDCCTVFTPKHPTTRPNIENILKSESHIPFDELCQKAIEGIETINIRKY
ncbi:MAG: tRNA uracil 4-sulfurtransferase ThiI [Clostridia bacterium]|nr:tRNA uracil 4-sulfurtransferase ThiI [Clostridia bacterium]